MSAGHFKHYSHCFDENQVIFAFLDQTNEI